MAIKFEKIQPGMVLSDVHRHKMGNTTMSEWGEWRVHIISVDAEKRTAVVSWNSYREQVWYAHQLEKLYLPDKLPKAYRDQQERKAARRATYR